MTVRLLSTLVALAAIGACNGGGPGSPDGPTLPYRIHVEPVVTLGSPRDSLLLDWNVVLAANGSLIVAGRLPTRGTFAVYDREGRQVRSVEAFGGGPGEFSYPRPVAGPGDSLWILDTGNQRVSVLAGDGSVARAFALRGEFAGIMPAGREHALVAGTMLPEGTTKEDVEDGSWPYLHVIDRHGAVLRSFLPRDASLGGMGAKIVAAAGDRVWVATMHRPTLEEWSLEGERLRTIDRELDWFAPWDSTDVQRLRFRPRVAGLGIDAEGRLWVKTYVPLLDRQTARSPTDYDRIMDTILEVVDPATGALLAQRRFDEASIRRVGGRDLWATARQDSSGYVLIDVWRARLRPAARD